MIIFATTLVPVFLLILLGYLLNRSQFPNESFWPLAARVTYFILLPALLIKTMATAALDDLPVMEIAVAFTLAISIVGTLLLLLRPRLPLNGPAFTSVMQGGIRQNTYVGLATVAGLLGEAELVFAAIALAVQVPVVNLWSVAVLAKFGNTEQVSRTEATDDANSGSMSIGGTLVAIVRNPLIIACVLGIALNPLLHWLGANELPLLFSLPIGWVLEALSVLGRAALPFGLLTVGAGLRLVMDRSALTGISVAIVAKLLLYPTVAAGLSLLLGLSGSAYLTVLIFAALPTSTSSYILAREMGGDHELMAAILTVETLLAMVSMPVMLFILS